MDTMERTVWPELWVRWMEVGDTLTSVALLPSCETLVEAVNVAADTTMAAVLAVNSSLVEAVMVMTVLPLPLFCETDSQFTIL